jgi:hypothetical protein
MHDEPNSLVLLALAVAAVVGSCGGTAIPGIDPSGTSGAGAGGPSVFDGNVVCTSNETWTHGDRGSSALHPGGVCIHCYETERGSPLAVAGTDYPARYEPDDCDGVGGGAEVVITDATGSGITLSVNSVGNFYSSASIDTRFHANVVSGGTREIALAPAQTSGD